MTSRFFYILPIFQNCFIVDPQLLFRNTHTYFPKIAKIFTIFEQTHYNSTYTRGDKR